ncbi:hypothetical protein I6E09_09695 [Mediterraneibacter glycyrrhizinilyticus]|uniref:Flp1 family type IVb pilin n=1 Tax=Mediterraneibacter glycyrrhizinilyticus TaxID=342942 RepID=UPI000B3704BE|nr:hypothetical protein [Mediterraneibacter glycyrrhizinilyticus]OUO31437.1 hypothetical protein B5F86_00630 [Lachnoclostridium sp. An298]
MAVYIKKIKQNTKSVKNRWKEIYMRHRYVSGITVIELVLILVIIIALLLIFKNQLIDLINTIFDKIISESSGI